MGTASGAVSWLVADNGPLWVGQQQDRSGWRTKRQPWRSEGLLGAYVLAARLVSNGDDDALLTWSAGGTEPGVYVAARQAP